MEIYLNVITLTILALMQQEEIYVSLARLLYRKTWCYVQFSYLVNA